MHRYKILCVLAVTSFLISGCKNDSDDPAITDTGSVQGGIRFANEFGVLLPAHSDCKVTAVGATSTMSNTAGEYSIHGLEADVYTLEFEKTGYGTYKRYNIPVQPGTGNGTTTVSGIDTLGAVSTTVITNLAVTLNTTDSTLDISCTVGPNPGPGTPRTFRLLFGNTNLVNPSDYNYAPTTTWTATTTSGVITGFQPGILYSSNMPKGSIAYVVAYGESRNSNSYFDQDLNKMVFPNLNLSAPSNIVQFIVP